MLQPKRKCFEMKNTEMSHFCWMLALRGPMLTTIWRTNSSKSDKMTKSYPMSNATLKNGVMEPYSLQSWRVRPSYLLQSSHVIAGLGQSSVLQTSVRISHHHELENPRTGNRSGNIRKGKIGGVPPPGQTDCCMCRAERSSSVTIWIKTWNERYDFVSSLTTTSQWYMNVNIFDIKSWQGMLEWTFSLILWTIQLQEYILAI